MQKEFHAKQSSFLDHLDESGWVELEESKVDPRDIFIKLSIYCSIDFRVEKTVLTPHDSPILGKLTLSGRFGFGKFPYHTDGAFERIPPRFIVFNYLPNVPSAAGTLLLDIHDISTSSIECRKCIHYDVYRVTADGGSFYTSIARKVHQTARPLYRYNPVIMSPSNKSTTSFESYLSDYEPKRIKWTPGKIVIVDNWRIIHAREPVPESERATRKIERFLLRYP